MLNTGKLEQLEPEWTSEMMTCSRRCNYDDIHMDQGTFPQSLFSQALNGSRL